ncbi:MAG: hypothetical protein SNJ72_10485 [Fimbriimonadales bacterium]
MLLRIDLQDGFEKDTVHLLMNGNLIGEYHEVQTDLRIGLALSQEFHLPEGAYTLTLEVRNRGLSASIPIELKNDTFLRVWIQNDSLAYEIGAEPYHYL